MRTPKFSTVLWHLPPFLYPHGKANEDDMEHGLFQSAILVKVWPIAGENDLENQATQPPKHNRTQKAPTRGNVASLLGMRSVTP